MSTTIYNVWQTDKSLDQIMRSAKRLKVKIEDEYRLRIVELLSKVSNPVHKIECALLMCENILKDYASNNPECSLVIYGVLSGNIVHTFGVRSDKLLPFVRSIDGKDVHYQNKTDPPDDVPCTEWTARRKMWDMLLPGTRTPSESGFSFEIVSKRRALEIIFQELRRSIPPPIYEQHGDADLPWDKWGPESYGIYLAQDAESLWGQERSLESMKHSIIKGWLKPFNLDELSLQSSCL